MKQSVVPVLRINNRSLNQTFLTQTLGFKTLCEEGPFAEFCAWGDQTVKLVLVESPSMRTRAVKGTKKLARLGIKAAYPEEIETLLASGISFTHLYRGEKGYAFEVLSPEKDLFLLHAEENLDSLVEITLPQTFHSHAEKVGLTQFEVDEIILNVTHPDQSQAFYEQVVLEPLPIRFQQAYGQDLATPAEEIWDLDSLRLSVSEDFDWVDLENRLQAPYFKDKRERFLQTVDPSQIEIWFEK